MSLVRRFFGSGYQNGRAGLRTVLAGYASRMTSGVVPESLNHSPMRSRALVTLCAVRDDPVHEAPFREVRLGALSALLCGRNNCVPLLPQITGRLNAAG